MDLSIESKWLVIFMVGGSAWQWLINNGNIESFFQIQYSDGQYWLKLTVDNGK